MTKKNDIEQEIEMAKIEFIKDTKKYFDKVISEMSEMINDLDSPYKDTQEKAIFFSKAMRNCLDTFNFHFQKLLKTYRIEWKEKIS